VQNWNKIKKTAFWQVRVLQTSRNSIRENVLFFGIPMVCESIFN
jgi:hypothetical protein